MSQPLPIIERRRIEAELLKEVYETLTERYGKDNAKQLIAESVRRSSIKQAAQFAAQAEGGTSLQSFIDIQSNWTAENALEIDPVYRDESRFDFNVTRCRYAEMYKAMGLGEIGGLLSCNRDGSFCDGYDPKLKMTRTQTIMEGASHCDFRYRYEADQAI
ncbi:L-2-amino-thiazoline-4-carboxylic acid hydrolase [Microvirga sp. HBU67558]|uniref:L-2-amino-thiazoline-4-carboxylic acid hydrolase n=1 Tax=Microvirga TaxID=186650 RepID=UPI001B39CA21|nr:MULTISPECIES: L-2-amino-thiazoline-4-carboxylic acid hydrolase [unclassified Microvirga]MBQ0820557.1 L-2-amino-thiazoline-4-carboxylic acid hydrolase [Microvirga sp. HBU67558]